MSRAIDYAHHVSIWTFLKFLFCTGRCIMLRNHYVPQARLKQFSKEIQGHDKLTYVDLKKKQIGIRNVKTSFYEQGLYDDDLEKELNEKVESPGMKIFEKINKSERFVTLTRHESEIVKKYLLIQNYRSPTNISDYGETGKEDVCRMMREILNHSWVELLYSNDADVRGNAQNMNKTMTLFIRSDFEFVINDLGTVTEKHYIPISDKETTKEILKTQLSKSRIEQVDEILKEYMNDYVDNFIFYPISSHVGIIVVSKIWVALFRSLNPYRMEKDAEGNLYTILNPAFYDYVRMKFGMSSKILKNIFVPCLPQSNDSYDYPIVDLNLEDAEYLNLLTIDEAQNFFAFGNDIDGDISICYHESKRLLDSSTRFNNDLSWIPLKD